MSLNILGGSLGLSLPFTLMVGKFGGKCFEQTTVLLLFSGMLSLGIYYFLVRPDIFCTDDGIIFPNFSLIIQQ